MTALAGPLHLLGLVLVVSGLQKVLRPGPAAQAMLAARLPVTRSPAAGVALGLIEASVGVVAVAVPEWWAAAALGGFYAALAAFVLRLRATDASAGCGCFGATSAPPGRAHLVSNVVAAAVGLGTAAAGVPDLTDVLGEGVVMAGSYLVLLAIGAGLTLVVPTISAEIAAIRRGDEPRSFAPTRPARSSA